MAMAKAHPPHIDQAGSSRLVGMADPVDLTPSQRMGAIIRSALAKCNSNRRPDHLVTRFSSTVHPHHVDGITIMSEQHGALRRFRSHGRMTGLKCSGSSVWPATR